MVSTSGETNIPIGDWTTGSLKVYHDDKIAALKELTDRRFTDNYVALQAALTAQEKAVDAALDSAKEAVSKAEAAAEKRFDSVNEFRRTLSDQTASFLPRPEYDAQHKALEDRVTELYERVTRNEGVTKGTDITMGKIYATIGAVGAVLGILVLLSNGVFR